MTKTNASREHLQRAIPGTCDLWDIWSEWWGDMTWPKKDNDNDKYENKDNDKDKLVTFDIWDTDYNFDNWEPEFRRIFVTRQLRVTLDSIRKSFNVFIPLEQQGGQVLSFSAGTPRRINQDDLNFLYQQIWNSGWSEFFVPTKVVASAAFFNTSIFASMNSEEAAHTVPVNLMTLVWSSISRRNSWHVELWFVENLTLDRQMQSPFQCREKQRHDFHEIQSLE